ncbi:MAG TPA: ABC transporter permease [Blastocatellia bacterium]|nr:ABC transporter permease [Blastocatellia bacterium]
MAAISSPEAGKQVTSPVRRVGRAGFIEYAGVALDSLRSNKLRTALTLLGIIIGITSIIGVISIIQGMSRYWTEKVANFGPNTFVVSQFPIVTNPDRFAEMIRRNKEIHSDAAVAITHGCPACEEIGVETHKSVTVKYRGQTVDQVDMSGMTPSIIDIEPYDVAYGRNILDWENDHAQPVTFIGWDVADKLYGGVDPIGKDIQIEDHWFRIVGVAAQRGSVFGFSRDNFAKIPLSAFEKIYGSRRTVNISIKAKPERMDEAVDQTRLVMRTLRHLNYNDEDNFGIITSEGVNALFESLTRVIFSVAIFVVGISLVVGGIVIMNIMLVSVVERTKEIGIRKALGARQQDVVNQFLVESVLLCCSGGAIGVSLAYVLSWMISHFTPLPSSFPIWAPFGAFALCTIIGLFFGIYPARRAGKMDPIEALRIE